MAIPKRKRSGGPKTEEGKAVASANSIKTGAYSSLVVLPNESSEDFQKLMNEFFLSLSPQGIVEEAIVQDLVAITWRKMRLDDLQRSAEERILSKPLRAIDINVEFRIDNEYDWLIQDISVLTEDLYQESIKHLKYIHRLSDYGISKDDFYELPKTNTLLYSLIVDLALKEFDYIDDPNPQPEQLMRLTKEYWDGETEPFVHYAMRAIKGHAKQIQWAYHHLDEIQTAIRLVREKRLLGMLQEVGLMRARDEMGRAFSKGLAELRKQQQWRLNMAIDVTPPKQD